MERYQNHSLAIPKVLYTLRSSPCFLTPILGDYDHLLRATLSTILNIHFGEDDPSWIQATLPIRCGGLGIRSAGQLAPSAFLVSAAACQDLAQRIIPTYLQGLLLPHKSEARAKWASTPNLVPPGEAEQKSQRAWDTPRVTATIDDLFKNAVDARSRSRSLAATSKESGAGLQALPLSSIGLRMDDNTVHIATGLRLGSPLCRPHNCQHCGSDVDRSAVHGLSCRWSEGRHFRHSALNDIVHRALSSARIPSRFEPSGISQSDGK